MPEINEKKDQGLVIDIEKLVSAPRGTKNKLDPDEDAWAVSAPPAHDIYCLKPILAKQGVRFHDVGTKDSYDRVIETPFYSINIEHRIIAESNPDVHMFPCFQPLT